MKTLEEVRRGLWLKSEPGTVMGSQFRLNEAEWKELLAALDREGYVIVEKAKRATPLDPNIVHPNQADRTAAPEE